MSCDNVYKTALDVKYSKIKGLIDKIQTELEAVEYEGLKSPRYWYADDRIETIKNICDNYLNNIVRLEKQ